MHVYATQTVLTLVTCPCLCYTNCIIIDHMHVYATQTGIIIDHMHVYATQAGISIDHVHAYTTQTVLGTITHMSMLHKLYKLQ